MISNRVIRTNDMIQTLFVSVVLHILFIVGYQVDHLLSISYEKMLKTVVNKLHTQVRDVH